MNTKFDELAKVLAQSSTRRQALKKFGVGLAGMALACFGLADNAPAAGGNPHCMSDNDCHGGRICCQDIKVPSRSYCAYICLI